MNVFNPEFLQTVVYLLIAKQEGRKVAIRYK